MVEEDEKRDKENGRLMTRAKTKRKMNGRIYVKLLLTTNIYHHALNLDEIFGPYVDGVI